MLIFKVSPAGFANFLHTSPRFNINSTLKFQTKYHWKINFAFLNVQFLIARIHCFLGCCDFLASYGRCYGPVQWEKYANNLFRSFKSSFREHECIGFLLSPWGFKGGLKWDLVQAEWYHMNLKWHLLMTFHFTNFVQRFKALIFWAISV